MFENLESDTIDEMDQLDFLKELLTKELQGTGLKNLKHFRQHANFENNKVLKTMIEKDLWIGQVSFKDQFCLEN